MKIHFAGMAFIAATFIAGDILHAQSEEYNIKLNEIRELLKPAASDNPATKQAKDYLASYPDQWQKMVDQEQFNQVSEYGVREMASSFVQIPGLTEKVQEFTRSLAAEVKRRDMAKIAEAEALFSQIGEILKFATRQKILMTYLPTSAKINKMNTEPVLNLLTFSAS